MASALDLAAGTPRVTPHGWHLDCAPCRIFWAAQGQTLTTAVKLFAAVSKDQARCLCGLALGRHGVDHPRALPPGCGGFEESPHA